jgi:hypothetical protein
MTKARAKQIADYINWKNYGKVLGSPKPAGASAPTSDEDKEIRDYWHTLPGSYSYYSAVVKMSKGKKKNPARRTATMAKRTSKAASRYGVYVGSGSSRALAYVSTKKLDANKAASKLKLSGRVGIKIKAVGPNPITGKLPRVGWREQFKTASRTQPKRKAAKTAKRRNSAISIVGPSRARRSVNPRFKSNYLIEIHNGQTMRAGDFGSTLKDARREAQLLSETHGLKVRLYRKGPGARHPLEKGNATLIETYDKGRKVTSGKANPTRKRNAASILMRRANPKASSAIAKPRTRYMVQVGETPAWVGKLKSDANKAWRALNAAGHKGLKIFKVQVTKVVKDGWRKAFKPGSSRNPNFPGRKGSGQRFKACVRTMSKRAGVYDPAGLCASIGRKKYGAKGMAKLAGKGRKRNPSHKGPYRIYAEDGREYTKADGIGSKAEAIKWAKVAAQAAKGRNNAVITVKDGSGRVVVKYRATYFGPEKI